VTSSSRVRLEFFSPAVALMDLGFATHAVHMDQRPLYLDAVLHEDKTKLTVTGPPTPPLFPPVPGFIFVVTDSGVPSFGHRTLIGTGASPPVDEDASPSALFVLYFWLMTYMLAVCSTRRRRSRMCRGPRRQRRRRRLRAATLRA
jgi:hypothetical protein